MKEDKKESDLQTLKIKYSALKEKYSLPEFDILNCNFYIEKLAGVESDFLIREIRRIVVDKLSDFLRFIEAMISPVDSSIIVFAMVKTLEPKDIDELKQIYKKLAIVELMNIKRSLDYSEEEEANLIKKGNELFQEVCPRLLNIIQIVEANWDKDFRVNGNGKGYFN